MLRINRWSETFENAKTRKLIALSWFSCPSGVDSAGYLELMSRGESGILAFAVFAAICQWSATCRPTIRGMIARSDGSELSVSQLALVIRMPLTTVESAIAILSDKSVGWITKTEIEKQSDLSQPAIDPPVVCQSPAIDPPVVSVQGKESNGKESNSMSDKSDTEPQITNWQQEIKDAFDATFGTSSRITLNRKRHLEARWKDPWWRENWKKALEAGGKSAFLRGDNDRGWMINFEFFVRPDTATNILEGKYGNGAVSKQSSDWIKALNAARQYPMDWEKRKQVLGDDLFEALKMTGTARVVSANDFELKTLQPLFEQNLQDIRNAVTAGN